MRSRRWADRVLLGLALVPLIAGCSSSATPTPMGGASPAPISVTTPASTLPVPPTVAAAAPTMAPPSPSANAVTGLDRVKAAGALVWCVDTSYPPMESVGASGTPEGLDIDVAAEVATRLGVTSKVVPTGWDSLLPDVTSGKCDLVISSMASTFGNRKDLADFVDYLTAWTALLVATGNPKDIRTLDDLASRTIAVEPGYMSEASLRAVSDALAAAGKPPIEILPDTSADDILVGKLTSGEYDALAGDSLVVRYRAAQQPFVGKAEMGGPAIDPQPIGIAVSRDAGASTLREAVAAAVREMTADGTMKALVAKWGLTDAVALIP